LGCWIHDLEYRVALTFLHFPPKVFTHAEHTIFLVLKTHCAAVFKSYEPLGKIAKSPRSILIAGGQS
jgi:hypothetical protein